MARGGPNETPKRNENQAPSGQKVSPHSLGYDNSSLLQRCIKHDEIYHKQQMFIYIYISYSAVGQQIPLLKLPKKEKRSLQLQDVFLVVYTLHEDIFSPEIYYWNLFKTWPPQSHHKPFWVFQTIHLPSISTARGLGKTQEPAPWFCLGGMHLLMFCTISDG